MIFGHKFCCTIMNLTLCTFCWLITYNVISRTSFSRANAFCSHSFTHSAPMKKSALMNTLHRHWKHEGNRAAVALKNWHTKLLTKKHHAILDPIWQDSLRFANEVRVNYSINHQAHCSTVIFISYTNDIERIYIPVWFT